MGTFSLSPPACLTNMLGICYPRQPSSKPRSLDLSFWVGSWEALAYRSWKHVLIITGGNESDTVQLYWEAVERVETQARAVYVDELRKKEQFLQVMIEYGCFILQVALFSFGGPKPLRYPPEDPFFGEKKWNKEQIRGLFTSIFSARKQIPLVVLKVLMKQKFFQDVLVSGEWRQPNDLSGRILYDLLVEPMLDGTVNQGNSKRRHPGFFNQRNRWYQEPTTPLNALWLLLTGPDSGGANQSEEDDISYAVGSAAQLQEAGITFKIAKGTRQIKFKTTMSEAYLYLPQVYLDPDIGTLFEHLIDYEACISSDRNRREVSAYICLLKELIRGPDDFKVLLTQGIINIDPEYEIELYKESWETGQAEILELGKRYDFFATHLINALWMRPLELGRRNYLAAIRHQIRSYVKPRFWPRIMNLVIIGFLLTFVQTVYIVLGYYHPFQS